VVGEWRDGTQLYFQCGIRADVVGADEALQPGMVAGGRRAADAFAGPGLEGMADDQFGGVGEAVWATHILLPAGKRTQLARVSPESGAWAVYEPRCRSDDCGAGGGAG